VAVHAHARLSAHFNSFNIAYDVSYDLSQ